LSLYRLHTTVTASRLTSCRTIRVAQRSSPASRPTPWSGALCDHSGAIPAAAWHSGTCFALRVRDPIRNRAPLCARHRHSGATAPARRSRRIWCGVRGLLDLDQIAQRELAHDRAYPAVAFSPRLGTRRKWRVHLVCGGSAFERIIGAAFASPGETESAEQDPSYDQGAGLRSRVT
jgi:hypothetical protein